VQKKFSVYDGVGENTLTALILTRPVHQNIELINFFKGSKVTTIDCPFIKIQALKNYALFDSIINQLNTYNYLIFISTNAVKMFIDRMDLLSLKLPKDIILASIGKSTREVLRGEYQREVYCPDNIFDSEHLLNHLIFNNIQSKMALIIRGEGGRETLKKGLESKGAKVTYGECYKRKLLPINFKEIKKITRNFKKTVFLITSNESAKHFISEVTNEDKSWLMRCDLIVNHEKIKKDIESLFGSVNVLTEIEPKDIKLAIKE
jgi:uroporphyrinogen-III synthase